MGTCYTGKHSSDTCLQIPQEPSTLRFLYCWSCESGYHTLFQSRISSAQSHLPRGEDYTTKDEIEVPLQVCNAESKTTRSEILFFWTGWGIRNAHRRRAESLPIWKHTGNYVTGGSEFQQRNLQNSLVDAFRPVAAFFFAAEIKISDAVVRLRVAKLPSTSRFLTIVKSDLTLKI